MTTYTLNTNEITSIKQINQMFESVIKIETGAIAEVTILSDKMLVYTEDTDKVELIKSLVGDTRNLIEQINYDADEDGSAAVTLKYSL